MVTFGGQHSAVCLTRSLRSDSEDKAVYAKIAKAADTTSLV